MSDLLQKILGGILRHGLTYGAGVLIAHGYLQSSQSEMLISASMALAGIVWSVARKWYDQQEAAPPPSQ